MGRGTVVLEWHAGLTRKRAPASPVPAAKKVEYAAIYLTRACLLAVMANVTHQMLGAARSVRSV